MSTMLVLGCLLITAGCTAEGPLTGPSGDVASVQVAPSSITLQPSGTQQFSAEARDADGNLLSGVSFSWSSSNTAVATVDDSGLATAQGEGSAQITAAADGEQGTASVSVEASGSTTVTAPELPREGVDTSFPTVSGQTLDVDADFGGDLQAAVDAAEPGDELVLSAGTVYPGPIRLPNKGSSSEYVVIRSNGLTNLPSGQRVTPSDEDQMPTIRAPSQNVRALEAVEQGVHHYWFAGVKFDVDPGVSETSNTVEIGASQSTSAEAPHHIVFDRCYFTNSDNLDIRRAIRLDGAHLAVVHSRIERIHSSTGDAQAILVINGPGPYKIHDNYLEASGENVMFGGADVKSEEVLPQDITITRNHFKKPLEWFTSDAWSVKNLLEFKLGKRILVQGNVFENNWPDAQRGFFMKIASVSQGGGCTEYCTTRDLTFRLNKVINVAAGVSVLALGSGPDDSNVPTRRVAIENVLFTRFGNDSDFEGTGGRVGTAYYLNGPDELDFRHVTILGHDEVLEFVGSNPVEGFLFDDNIVDAQVRFARYAEDGSTGTEALESATNGWQVRSNVIVAGDSASDPSGNSFPASRSDVGFVDLTNWNLRLDQDSPYKGTASDGTDPGADIDAVEAETEGVAGG